MRTNHFGFPHKALRYALGKISFLAGKASIADAEALNELITMVEEVAVILDLHAHAEEAYILPHIDERVPNNTEHNRAEHVKLDNDTKALVASARALENCEDPTQLVQFYDQVNDYIAFFFLHMGFEEKKLLPVMWENFSDEELFAVHDQVMSSLKPEQVMVWFKYMAPALTNIERRALMAGVQANAPEDVFEDLLEFVQQFLTDSESADLNRFFA